MHCTILSLSVWKKVEWSNWTDVILASGAIILRHNIIIDFMYAQICRFHIKELGYKIAHTLSCQPSYDINLLVDGSSLVLFGGKTSTHKA